MFSDDFKRNLKIGTDLSLLNILNVEEHHVFRLSVLSVGFTPFNIERKHKVPVKSMGVFVLVGLSSLSFIQEAVSFCVVSMICNRSMARLDQNATLVSRSAI